MTGDGREGGGADHDLAPALPPPQRLWEKLGTDLVGLSPVQGRAGLRPHSHGCWGAARSSGSCRVTYGAAEKRREGTWGNVAEEGVCAPS